jgi:hypothetical protein
MTKKMPPRTGTILQIYQCEIIDVFHSQIDAVRKTGVTANLLSQALNGINESCGGYEWKYAKGIDGLF